MKNLYCVYGFNSEPTFQKTVRASSESDAEEKADRLFPVKCETVIAYQIAEPADK